jgi:Helix-turn-helix domain
MEQLNQNPFLNVAEAADFLRLRKRTLDNMRWMGTGPSFRKHGGRIFYHIDELKEWSLATKAKSTSQF